MDDRLRKTFRKIVITGGPCAGKTTGLTWIQNTFEQMGYIVLIMSEPATEIKTSGITPMRCSTPMAYQHFQMKFQYEKEKVFERAAADIACAKKDEENGIKPAQPASHDSGEERKAPAQPASHDSGDVSKAPAQSGIQNSEDAGDALVQRKVLLVCDRGFFDNRAYMPEEEFQKVLRELGTTEEEMMRGYDGIFHLETTAKYATAFYGFNNNAVRDETPEEACEVDDRLIKAWSKHPQHYVIQNISGFEKKMVHLIAEIASCLGEQEPPEIRRRYLIDFPDLEALKNIADRGITESMITQNYLYSADDEEIRLRMRQIGKECMYYATKKKIRDGVKHLVAERRLSQREYLDFLNNAIPEKGMVRKKRCSLFWKGQRYDIDMYPFWVDRALLEISLSHEHQKIEVPPVLRIRKEVTGDESYEISYLSMRHRGQF